MVPGALSGARKRSFLIFWRFFWAFLILGAKMGSKIYQKSLKMEKMKTEVRTKVVGDRRS